MTTTLTPGIVAGMSNEAYHAHPSLSRSRLKLLLDGPPLDFHAAIPVEETPAMRLGTAAHLAILEPEAFDARVVAQPDFGDCRFKENKERKAAWTASLPEDAIAIPQDEYDVAREAARIVRSKRGPATALRSGQAELSMFWEQDGVPTKSRPDLADIDRGLVCDIKTTTRGLDDRQVVRILVDGYAAMQAAMVNCAHHALLGRTVDCYLLVVRLQRPVDMRLVHITAEWMSYGEDQFMRALAIYRKCVASGEWKGWADEAVTSVPMPKWLAARAEETFAENVRDEF